LVSRIELNCEILGRRYKIWIDTGSPNSLVHSDFAERLKLTQHKGQTYSGKISGTEFRNKRAVTIPEINIPGCRSILNVRVIAALDGDEWKDIILIGLNVLNHLTYKIDRDPMPGTFEWLESLTSKVEGSSRTRFDHLIMNGRYLLSDSEDSLVPSSVFNKQ